MRLELRGVEASYGGAPVLRNVDLVVPRGCVAALLGANGAGKTTLLRVASGLLSVTRGQVGLDGVDLGRLAPHQRAALGVVHVPGNAGIFRSLSVRQNLKLQAPRGGAPEALDEAVARFPRLGERIDQIAGRLSGGEQQMLALARTHHSEARCILLDEVSLGLAPRIVDEIFADLEELARAGRSLLIVEQYVNKALGLADIAYVLHQGQIVFAGQPDELERSDLFAQYLGVPA